MITFFMPLGNGSRWDNKETTYLLRSLDKNFLEEYRFIIYADTGVEVNLNVEVIQWMDRFYPELALKKNKGTRHFENYFCVLDKVRKFVMSDDCPDEFVYIYDDILLNKKISSIDIMNVAECLCTGKVELIYRRSKHGKTILKAMDIGESRYRYEHHLPLIYKKDLLQEMFAKYPLEDTDVPYALATAYFNLFFKNSLTLENVPNYKAGFEGFDNALYCYKQDSVEEIERAAEGKTWINYNDTGLFWMPDQYPLQKWIEKEFNEKSKYER